MTDENNIVVWEAVYLPFGQAIVNPNSREENNHRFPGQYYDAETGFHYNWHRYYSPAIGRYLRSDPIGLDGGLNLFLYADGNPVMNIDLKGLACGPGFWGDLFIPDYPWGNFNFKNACEFHDRCYATCNMSKPYCDKAFYHLLLNYCKKFKNVNIYKYRLCKNTALIYYKKVKKYGHASYRKGQIDDCNCRNIPIII